MQHLHHFPDFTIPPNMVGDDMLVHPLFVLVHNSLTSVAETYAASWIVPKSLFLQSDGAMHRISSLEGATTSLLERNHHRVLMTRDYMDYFVEHLSSTTNQLLSTGSDRYLLDQLQSKAKHFRKFVRGQNVFQSPFANDTIAIMPFSMHTYRPAEDPLMRILFFELTYLSVYLHFPKIVVAIQDDKHLTILQNMRIPPPYHIFKNYADERNVQEYDLMKSMLLSLHNALSSSSEQWRPFQRVFFTECDQILHMRTRMDIYLTMLNSQEEYLMVPHRFQVSV